jgi:pyridoxine 5-phosphate synthase
LHTGAYCDALTDGHAEKAEAELTNLREMSAFAHSLGLEVHAGHGLTYDTVPAIAAFPEVKELNIGHFLIGEAIFLGLEPAILEMRRLMDIARAV